MNLRTQTFVVETTELPEGDQVAVLLNTADGRQVVVPVDEG